MKEETMVRVVVAGAAGRMGSRIVALAHEHEGIELAGAFEAAGHARVGEDAGEVAGVGPVGLAIEDDLRKVIGAGDVIVDFTHPDGTLDNLRLAAEHGVSMVIGTTGFSSDTLSEARSLGGRIPCVLSFNMSLGVNLLLKVIGDIAGALGDDYDVEVVEAHHRLKKDAPSGTALLMARAASEALGRDFDRSAVFARHGMIGERGRREIGIQTLRAGDIVGEHTVLFGGLGERVEVTHRVSSRDTFARGALRASLWLSGRPAGLYDMQDVLGLR
jgi:4-hydroxy-tetrahydrodipicolinate reductase